IGHKENDSLLQRISDKFFITPTAFGQYLNDIYNQTMEELQNSKAKLIDDITIQLKANYQKQIQNLNEKIKGIESLNNENIKNIKKVNEEALQHLKSQLASLTTQYQNQLKEKDNRLRSSNELTNGFKGEIERLRFERERKQAEPSSTGYVWIWVVIVIILVIVVAKTCGN